MESILEEWRDVVGYEGLYQVSNLGKVRRYYGREIKYLKGFKTKNGYMRIGLCKNGKMKTFYIHRLAWEGFYGTIPSGMQIDHINTIRDDNRLSNLRCVTPSENHRNPITRVRYLEALKKLSENPQWREKMREVAKKRSEIQEYRNRQREGVRRALSKPVLQINKDTNEVIREWPSALDAARGLKINNGNISACCNGRQKTAGGFKWKFA